MKISRLLFSLGCGLALTTMLVFWAARQTHATSPARETAARLITYTYSLNGLLTQANYGGLTLTYGYDDSGNPLTQNPDLEPPGPDHTIYLPLVIRAAVNLQSARPAADPGAAAALPLVALFVVGGVGLWGGRASPARRARLHKALHLVLVLSFILPVIPARAATPDQRVPLSPLDGHALTGLDVGDPIAANSGAFAYHLPLLTLGGPFPLTWDLTYRTDNFEWLHLGAPAFWQHSLLPAMEHYGPYVHLQTFLPGELVTFEQAGSTFTLYEPMAHRFTLQVHNNFYYLQDIPGGRLYVFQQVAPTWRIEYVEDRNHNRWTYTYPDGTSPYPTQLADGLGRTLAFTWSGDQLTGVTDFAGRTLTYTWSGAQLTSVTDARGQLTTFGLDANAGLTTVTRPLGNTPYTQTYALIELNGSTELRVTSQTDAYGHVTTLAYNSTINEVTVTYPTGAEEVYQHFSNYGAPQALEDATAHTATFTQNAQGQSTGVTDRLGGTTSAAYAPESGLLNSLTNAAGETIALTTPGVTQTFTNPLDGAVRTFTFYNVNDMAFPDATTRQLVYDARGNLLQFEDEAGRVWTYTYDPHGLNTGGTLPGGGVFTNTYNADGTLASYTEADPGMGVITFSYDAYKRPSRVTYPGGAHRDFTYNLNDQLLTESDENGAVTTYAYDANGNLTRVADALGQPTLYTYDLLDRLNSVTDRTGGVTTFTYTSLNNLASTVDPTGVTTTYMYDLRGWLTAITRGSRTWTLAYDLEGQPTALTPPSGHVTTLAHNVLGLPTAIADPLGNSQGTGYDVLNRVTQQTDGNGRTTTYTYHPGGLLAGVTLPGGQAAEYVYDLNGQLATITGLGEETWQFAYTPMGRPASMTDPLGQVNTYTYDSRGRLTQADFANGALTAEATYDAASNLTGQTFSTGLALAFTYDALHRPTAMNGLALAYDFEGRVTNTVNFGTQDYGATYDAAGRLLTATYDEGTLTVTYTYSPTTGLLSGVTDSLSGATLAFQYDADGRLAGMQRSNGVDSTYTYDAAGRLIGIHDLRAGQTVLGLDYTLDESGAVAAVGMTAPLDPATVLQPAPLTLAFDGAGQITTPGYTYDALGRQTAAPGHLLYQWDGAGRLVGVEAVTLGYNALGEVITRTQGGQTTQFAYHYAFGTLAAESHAGVAERYYVYTPGGELLYAIEAASQAPVFYHFDYTGSTLALTNAAGGVSDAYAYDPYGNLLAHTGSSVQPFTFVGRHGVRQEGGLYQMGARYYDPQTTRFLSREPLWPNLGDPRQLSPYQYALGDPVNYVDPTGSSPEESELRRIENMMAVLSGVIIAAFTGLSVVVGVGVASTGAPALGVVAAVSLFAVPSAIFAYGTSPSLAQVVDNGIRSTWLIQQYQNLAQLDKTRQAEAERWKAQVAAWNAQVKAQNELAEKQRLQRNLEAEAERKAQQEADARLRGNMGFLGGGRPGEATAPVNIRPPSISDDLLDAAVRNPFLGYGTSTGKWWDSLQDSLQH
jgi:RHS repeat-associated protein